MMQISEAGLSLIRSFEGVRLTAYQDVEGIWTIGVGHTGKDVHPGLVITDDQANDLLVQDAAYSEHAVEHLVTVPLNQGKYDALCSFIFNLGAGRLQTSTLLKLLNAGNYAGAAAQFGVWVYSGGKKLPGLVARREAEQKTFES